MYFRVIPFLSLIGRRLVKTKQFDKPQYLGDPLNAVRIFNDKQVDELFIVDIRASKEGRSPDISFISEIAGECFMPIGYGGGISTFEQAVAVFAAGAEKIMINSANKGGFGLIEKVAATYGSQSVIAGFDYRKSWAGSGFFTHSAEKRFTKDLAGTLKRAVTAGAGEIFLMDADREGCRVGINIELLDIAVQNVQIPVIISGGARNLDDFKQAYEHGAGAVVAGSAFLYQNTDSKSILINYPEPGQLDFFRQERKLQSYE